VPWQYRFSNSPQELVSRFPTRELRVEHSIERFIIQKNTFEVETVELLKKVRTIEIKTRGLINNIFAGEYHSAFKGRGMAFSEVREYQYGDSIRDIDWNVTARFNRPFIKVFEEERELTVMMLIDVSGSRDFGTRQRTKRELITEVAAVLAFSAIKNNDKIGVLLFSDKIEMFIPPQKGKKHTLRIIRELIEFEPSSKGTNVSEAVRYFTNMIKKRCTAFIVSDFIDNQFADALSIANKKHDLIALHVFDERELTLPNVGLARVKDPETGDEMWLDTSSRKVRERYETKARENARLLDETFRRSGVDVAKLPTNGDYVIPLMKLFKRR
jgi:uncharacterized protein (DUF58 family)